MRFVEDVYGRRVQVGDYVTYIRSGRDGFVRLDKVIEITDKNKARLESTNFLVMPSRTIKMSHTEALELKDEHFGRSHY